MSLDLNALKEALFQQKELRRQKLKEHDSSFSDSLLANRKIYDGKQSFACDRYHLSRDMVCLATIDPPNPQDFLTPLPFSFPRESLDESAKKWSKSSEDGRGQRQWVWSKMPREIKASLEPVASGIDKLLELHSNSEWLQKFNSPSQNPAKHQLASLIKFLLSPLLPALDHFPWYCPLILPHEISSFLAFLEYEALRANTSKPFWTLLLTRLLIYTGLPAKKLVNLQHHPKNPLLLTLGEETFPLSDSFAKICQHLSFSGYLLPAPYRQLSSPEKELNIKVKRAGQRHCARLSGNGVKGPYSQITPTTLRNTLPSLNALGSYTYAKGASREELSTHSQKIEEGFKKMLKENGLNRFLGR